LSRAQPNLLPGGLTMRQANFVTEYLRTGVAIDAFKRAGYSWKNSSPNTLKTDVYKLLRHPKIVDAIGKAHHRAAEKSDLTVDKLQRELMRIAFSDVSEICDWTQNRVILRSSVKMGRDQTAAIAEVKKTKDGVVVRMHDKLSAIDKLCKMLGLAEGAKKAGDDAKDVTPETDELRKKLFKLLSDRNRSDPIDEPAIPALIDQPNDNG